MNKIYIYICINIFTAGTSMFINYLINALYAHGIALRHFVYISSVILSNWTHPSNAETNTILMSVFPIKKYLC